MKLQAHYEIERNPLPCSVPKAKNFDRKNTSKEHIKSDYTQFIG